MGATYQSDVAPGDFDEVRWHGHWIWVPEEPVTMGNPITGTAGDGKEVHGLFRRAVTLNAVPLRVPARMTADSRYALYVNGTEVQRGPARSQPRRMLYDMFDLAPFLRAGENIIAVHVKYLGTATASWMPAVPNATLGRTGVMVFEANLGNEWLVSDITWQAHRGDAWSALPRDDVSIAIAGGVPTEIYDARDQPDDWRQADFDDSTWAPAQPITAVHIGGRGRSQPPTDPYGPLFPRMTAALTGRRVAAHKATVESLTVAPDFGTDNPAERVEKSVLSHAEAAAASTRHLPASVAVPQGGYARIRIDMGRIVGGLVEFTVDAPAGTVLDVAYHETPITAPAQFGAHGGNRYIARGRADNHTVFDPKAFRFAYILVHGTDAPVTLTHFAVQERHYRWQPGASFTSSDDELNQIFAAGIRTVQLNSWDAFMDCPTREQRAWVGDAVVHQMVHLVTNTDWRLAWHYLALSNSPRYDGILPMSVGGDVEATGGFTIPDWSLHWIHGVHNLYRFTGNRARVKEFMPTMERVLRWYLPYLTKHGILQDVVEWNLIDWSSLFSQGQSAIVTASWARGLREFAEMAAWLDERASQAWADELYAEVKTGFELFWDEARSTYVDFAENGVPQRPVNQLAGALAIVSRLAPETRWARIIDTITAVDRLVVRSWLHFDAAEFSPEEAQARRGRFFTGGLVPDWDVETEIVMAEPFMSYVVHDAVAMAGMADRLPALYRRWREFLVDGYDTLGENWGHGTHVHGWSSTPTKDMVFYTLGVTPAEPGYTTARIAPRLGELDWVKGSVPTPHGLIHLDARREQITLTSPVPVILDLPGQTPQRLEAGAHSVAT